MRIARALVRLYPADVRFAYGEEMLAELARGMTLGRLLAVVCEAAADRAHTVYSHGSFHGRCRPNPGRVRPPNMSKREWFLEC